MNRLVILAHDIHAAESIRRALRHGANCEVIGFISARRPFGLTVRTSRPDIVLVDDPFGSDAVLAHVRELRAAVPAAKLVLLAAVMTADRMHAATAAGANAAIARSIHPAALGTLVREIAEGRVYHSFSPAAAEPALPREDVGLTPRELEILRLVASGASNSQIARDLWVTEQTVKFHLSNTYRKLGVENRTQASHFAYTRGLLDPPGRVGSDVPAVMAA
jgi:DNA-binding NarL/FixJ family response regulator